MPPVRQDEHPEYPFAGPFPGLQSEVAPSQIGNAGFAECQNIIFRNSTATIVPAFTPVSNTSPDGTPIMGTFDFFDSTGVRHSGVFTKTGMFEYISGNWTKIPPFQYPASPPGKTVYSGVPLTGGPTNFFQTAVVGYKLFFSNQVQQIQVYDPVSLPGGYVTAQVDDPLLFPPGVIGPGFVYQTPPPARYLMELGFHLVAANTMEGTTATNPGTLAPNRVHWSAIGNGLDWTTFTAGQSDIFNNLGPITGLTRLFQTGYIFQFWGVTQMVPTGIGQEPFEFISMGAFAKGNILPYTLAAFGELIACYVAKDDLYIFDGTTSQPFGQHPIDGNRRLGARTRIFGDIFRANPVNVWAAIMTSANGNTYQSYWLFLPSLNKAWVHNFDEGNWTQIYFEQARLNGPVGVSFQALSGMRIMDLVGSIGQQNWSAVSLAQQINLLDAMVIADNNVNSVSYFNFSQPASQPTLSSIHPGDGWYIRSGPLDFDDNRHPHTVNKVRMVLTDVGRQTFYIRLTNEVGYQTPLQMITLGTGSGTALTNIVDLQNGITGKYITWELSGPPGIPFQLVEITPYPVLGGEVATRCEVVVSPTGPPTPPVTPPGAISVSISPGTASLAPGGTQLFTATVTGSAISTVTWNASQGTITAAGLYTAPNVTTATTVTITAIPAADPTQSATINISVQPVSAAISVTIAPTGGTVPSAGTMSFSAIVNNSLNQNVTWTATPGTITSAGVYTAPSVTSVTSATITATAQADTSASSSVTISVQPPVGPAPIDLIAWSTLDSRATQHLTGDLYAVQVLDTDPIYPASYPRGVIFFIKNKLGHPWDIWPYDQNHVGHWITENGDSVDDPTCQAANGTTCWLYNRAYKRHPNPMMIMPRYITPGAAPVVINAPAPNDANRTTNCESTFTVVHLGDVQGVTDGPLKISWGGSIDHGSGTLANGPNFDNVNGVDTIRSLYYYSGQINGATFKDREEYYWVKGFGRIAWYHYHRTDTASPWTLSNKTINNTLAAGGAPVPDFPCGAGKSWW